MVVSREDSSGNDGDNDLIYFDASNLVSPCTPASATCELRVVRENCQSMDAGSGDATPLPARAMPNTSLAALVSPPGLAMWLRSPNATASALAASANVTASSDQLLAPPTPASLDYSDLLQWPPLSRCLNDGDGCSNFDPTPLLTGAACAHAAAPPLHGDAFFEAVACKGAFASPSDNWLQGWSYLYQPARPPPSSPPSPPTSPSTLTEASLDETPLLHLALTLLILLLLLLLLVTIAGVVSRCYRAKPNVAQLDVSSAQLDVSCARCNVRRKEAISDDAIQLTSAIGGAPATAQDADTDALPPTAHHLAELCPTCHSMPPPPSPAERGEGTGSSVSSGATIGRRPSDECKAKRSAETSWRVTSDTPSVFQAVAAFNEYRAWERVRVLGRGTSGYAVLLMNTTDRTQMAVSKQVVVEGMTPAELRRVENEVLVLQALSHRSPNIIAYLDCFHEQGQLCIITEYAEGGTLTAAISGCLANNLRFPPATLHLWAYQLGAALSLVHASSILHRDLKSANIFLTKDGHVKIGDFGLSRRLGSATYLTETVCGTPYYLSPEKVNCEPYGEPSDVWALGVVLYELLTLQRPFKGENVATLVLSIAGGHLDEEVLRVSGHPPCLTEICTSRMLLQVDALERTTLTDLLDHLESTCSTSGLDPALIQPAKRAHEAAATSAPLQFTSNYLPAAEARSLRSGSKSDISTTPPPALPNGEAYTVAPLADAVNAVNAVNTHADTANAPAVTPMPDAALIVARATSVHQPHARANAHAPHATPRAPTSAHLTTSHHPPQSASNFPSSALPTTGGQLASDSSDSPASFASSSLGAAVGLARSTPHMEPPLPAAAQPSPAAPRPELVHAHAHAHGDDCCGGDQNGHDHSHHEPLSLSRRLVDPSAEQTARLAAPAVLAEAEMESPSTSTVWQRHGNDERTRQEHL